MVHVEDGVNFLFKSEQAHLLQAGTAVPYGISLSIKGKRSSRRPGIYKLVTLRGLFLLTPFPFAGPLGRYNDALTTHWTSFSNPRKKSMEKQIDGSYYVAADEAAKESKLDQVRVASFSSISHQPDELELAGLVPPTEEEMETLRHVPDKINWSAYSKSLLKYLPVSR